MADPNKFKSVSVPIDTYRKLEFLANGKFLHHINFTKQDC